MTTKDLAIVLAEDSGYEVDADGIIQSFGKFEGECVDVLYWHDAYMNGDGEYLDESTQMFDLDDDERVAFNVTAKRAFLLFSDSGFVSLSYED